MTAEKWNSMYRVGWPVMVQRDDGSYVDGKTTSEAYRAASGHDVIHVDVIRGFYSLDRVSARHSDGSGD